MGNKVAPYADEPQGADEEHPRKPREPSNLLDLPDKFYYLAEKYHHGLTDREKINIRIDPVFAIAHLVWVISTTCEPDALIQYRDLLAQYKRTSYYKELINVLR